MQLATFRKVDLLSRDVMTSLTDTTCPLSQTDDFVTAACVAERRNAHGRLMWRRQAAAPIYVQSVNEFLSNKRCPCWRHGARQGRENGAELVAAARVCTLDSRCCGAWEHSSTSVAPSPPALAAAPAAAAARKSALIRRSQSDDAAHLTSVTTTVRTSAGTRRRTAGSAERPPSLHPSHRRK